MKTTMDIFERAEVKFGRYFCRRCIEANKIRQADERYSMDVYAGMYCDACWKADGRNHDRQFDPADAGEAFYETDY